MDTEGSVVLSFDRSAAASEGDLTSFLNHQEKHGRIMVEFRWVGVGAFALLGSSSLTKAVASTLLRRCLAADCSTR